MKREWKKPVLEVLDVSKTFLGPGVAEVDFTHEDEDEIVHIHKS